jgi:hypothetical protein
MPDPKSETPRDLPRALVGLIFLPDAQGILPPPHPAGGLGLGLEAASAVEWRIFCRNFYTPLIRRACGKCRGLAPVIRMFNAHFLSASGRGETEEGLLALMDRI